MIALLWSAIPDRDPLASLFGGDSDSAITSLMPLILIIGIIFIVVVASKKRKTCQEAEQSLAQGIAVDQTIVKTYKVANPKRPDFFSWTKPRWLQKATTRYRKIGPQGNGAPARSSSVFC